MKKDKLRNVPFKNYIYLGLVFLVTILILYYIYLWYQTYREDILNKGIMNEYLNVINFNELDNYIAENGDAVIYVSKLGDDQINKFEAKFRNTVVDNSLRSYILYLDVTNENINNVNNKLGIDGNLPYLVVYTDGVVTSKYSIVKNNYSTKKIEKYLNRIGIFDED